LFRLLTAFFCLYRSNCQQGKPWGEHPKNRTHLAYPGFRVQQKPVLFSISKVLGLWPLSFLMPSGLGFAARLSPNQQIGVLFQMKSEGEIYQQSKNGYQINDRQPSQSGVSLGITLKNTRRGATQHEQPNDHQGNAHLGIKLD
jgi:hypothetical protein